MTTSTREFQIQLDGLITLLAQNLYADPDVFLREMVQNAHDSIIKRQALEGRGAPAGPPPEIRIEIDEGARALSIIDNGAGLTESEIDDYLSTIGRSGTRELREHIKSTDRQRAAELIGQFGIGLLSAFIVSDRVEVITRSANAAAFKWTATGGKEYTVEPAKREHVGSTVRLRLKPLHTRYLDPDHIREVVRRYADFIGVPVRIGSEPRSINAVDAPWHRDYDSSKDRVEAYHAYWEQKFKGQSSLSIFDVDEPIVLEDPERPEESIEGRVRGVLGITDRRVPDVNVRGTVDLYIRRMFICSGSRDVLPSWARFIEGVIECDVLTPNAARDDAIRNEALHKVQARLGERIIAHLTMLSKHDRPRLVEIMRWHSYHVLAMSILDKHAEFFHAVADMVALASDRGPITVPDYLRDAPARGDGRRAIYYISERGWTLQYYMLCEARGLRVFNCAEPFAESFLKRYAETRPDRVVLKRLDLVASDEIFRALDEDEKESFDALAATCTHMFAPLGCIAQVDHFLPEEVPALITQSQAGNTSKEIERMAEDPSIPPFLRQMMSGILRERREPITLHLNADNPTIQNLARRGRLRDEVTRIALLTLFNNAAMLSGRVLDPRQVFDEYNRVIDMLMALSRLREETLSELRSREAELKAIQAGDDDDEPLERTVYVSCFVALPFDDPRAQRVYEALGRIFEGHPHYWQLVRADDAEHRGHWRSVEAHLRRAHCYIALVSGGSPEVMLEIGRMEALGRPLLLLHEDGARALPPALDGRPVGEYRGEGDELEQSLRELLGKQAWFTKQRGQRHLSQRAMLDEVPPEIAAKLAQRFATWEELLRKAPDDVARELGIKPRHVRNVQDMLAEHMAQAKADDR